MATSKYSVNDLVYLVESAKVGQIESYKVSSVYQGPDGIWYYYIGVGQRIPPISKTLTDRNTGKTGIDWELSESEITDICTALDLAEQYHTNQLNKIRALINSKCNAI